ncbi:MAG: heavy metal translocating P-type ATPase [Gammaproteobacteria bacterium]|nr:heavy metal translocating P-type ATPase [Gammaproteobacteria bacterium]
MTVSAGEATFATDNPTVTVSAADLSRCFHCGQENDAGAAETYEVLGRPRHFCCQGCLAVARSIVDAGLDDYYRYREDTALTADVVPDIVRQLHYYDHPDVQRTFVRGDQIREASFLLENVRCAACLWLNEHVLRGLDGVVDVDLDYASHHAHVRWDPQRIKLSEILLAITNIGYVAHPYDPSRREELQTLQRRRSTERLIFAGVIGMMVMNFAIAGYVMGLGDETGALSLWTRIGRWTSLFATTVLLAYPGQEFFVGAWRDLRHRRLGMDVPIVLGLSIAYLGSLHATWTQQGDVYFDSIAMFVFLVLLARRIELRARTQATDALDRVGRILPRFARRIDADGEHDVLVSALNPGDQVRVHPGESVPSDGILVSDIGSFDESLLSGEARPVIRQRGDTVVGGSCNIDQPVTIEISRHSMDSVIADIHRTLASGQREAPRYARLAQRAAGWFVAGVLLIALCTAAAWYLIDTSSIVPNTIAVLIVTCPCAFALATPVAAAITAGRLADKGMLVLRSDAIENLSQCDTFVFDKTGTLTSGQFGVIETHCAGDLDRTRAAALAAALEAESNHPIGRSLVDAAGSTPPVASDVVMHAGLGLSGRVDGDSWRIGQPEFAFDDRTSAHFHDAIDAARRRGDLCVAMGDEAGRGALFIMRDQRRAGLREMISDLRTRGITRLAVLSGDHPLGTETFAEGLGFDVVLGAQSPSDKLAWIRSEQRSGRRVAMVGDGINDAPTLAGADVSVSFGHATDLAQANCGLLVLGEDLRAIALARGLAIASQRIVRMNLTWAAAYNLLAVPAAAFGAIAPWGAAIGMSLSSLFVVINALRLKAKSSDPVSHTDERRAHP